MDNEKVYPGAVKVEVKQMISVLLPHYGHRAYLMDAVQSIINQTYEDWELLIMNDDPGVDLRDYEKLDSRIKVRSAMNRLGQPWQLNFGLDVSCGEYIAFQDADDYSIPQRLSIEVEAMKEWDLVYGDGIGLSQDGPRKYIAPMRWDREVLRTRAVGCFASTMVKRWVFEKAPFDTSIGYGNDWIWYIRASRITNRITRLELPLFYYRYHTSQFNQKFRMTLKRRKLKRQVRDEFERDVKSLG